MCSRRQPASALLKGLKDESLLRWHHANACVADDSVQEDAATSGAWRYTGDGRGWALGRWNARSDCDCASRGRVLDGIVHQVLQDHAVVLAGPSKVEWGSVANHHPHVNTSFLAGAHNKDGRGKGKHSQLKQSKPMSRAYTCTYHAPAAATSTASISCSRLKAAKTETGRPACS